VPYSALRLLSFVMVLDLILDTVRGQFQCPLCKKLSNFISPVYNPSQTIAPWKEENEEGRIADWVTWIDSPSFVNEPSSPPSPHEIPMVLSEPTVETTEVVVPSPVLVAHQDARPRTASGNRGTPRYYVMKFEYSRETSIFCL